MLHALTRPEGDSFRALAGVPEQAVEGMGPAWDILWVDGIPLGEAHHGSEGSYGDLTSEEEADEDLVERLAWVYPHKAAGDIPPSSSGPVPGAPHPIPDGTAPGASDRPG